VHPIADTFAYCLMRNHYHLLVRIKETSQVSETCEVCKPSQAFSNLFNAYTKAINKAYGRTGSLFEERFSRIEVTGERYFMNLIFYIHFNSQKHGFVSDFREWPWSSFHALQARSKTRLNRAEVLDWFGNAEQFERFHRGSVDELAIKALIDEDLA
jgi:putative transposase